ncbi:hypothetical protein JOC86_003126 [Bacillus pakistanensis]|uniref:DUF4145 domain-containing protein n=1 Tax=Rossellomorea pakistanensis TaxID=992288 RepID=A0ABS2NFE8_9BACI|nr:hypothetical protein [Bacillus pakistanensis]MBM7586574.1 hypothetical protein [Bacillus pakistanensis]
MKKINPATITSYSQFGYVKVPKTIQYECPRCLKMGSIELKANSYQSNHNELLLSKGKCNNCNKTSEFVIATPSGTSKGQNQTATNVYIYDTRGGEHPLDQLKNNEKIPKDLIRAFHSALNVYESKDYSATAVMSKRVLESVAKSFIGEESFNQSLTQQFEELPKYVDFSKPMVSLSHLLNGNGEFNKILDLEHEMDDETAELVIDMLEALIEYLFILPQRIENAQKKIEQRVGRKSVVRDLQIK